MAKKPSKDTRMFYSVVRINIKPGEPDYARGFRIVLEQPDYDRFRFVDEKQMASFCYTHCLAIIEPELMTETRRLLRIAPIGN